MGQNKFLMPLNIVVYTTSKGTSYIYCGLSGERIVYSINGCRKYLPFETIYRASLDDSNEIVIDRKWFARNFPKENAVAPCNLKVVQSLLRILKNFRCFSS